MPIIKAGKEFEVGSLDDVQKAAREFAEVAHRYFVRNGWTYLNPGANLFLDIWNPEKNHVPTKEELVDVMVGHYLGWKAKPTSYGRSSGRLRFEPRANGKFRFDVWEEGR